MQIRIIKSSSCLMGLGYLPVRKTGMETKKPPTAQTRVTDDFCRYLFVLKANQRRPSAKKMKLRIPQRFVQYQRNESQVSSSRFQKPSYQPPGNLHVIVEECLECMKYKYLAPRPTHFASLRQSEKIRGQVDNFSWRAKGGKIISPAPYYWGMRAQIRNEKVGRHFPETRALSYPKLK